jgi:hypothetical protein
MSVWVPGTRPTTVTCGFDHPPDVTGLIPAPRPDELVGVALFDTHLSGQTQAPASRPGPRPTTGWPVRVGTPPARLSSHSSAQTS